MTPLFKKLNFKNHKAILVLNGPASFVSEKEVMASETIFYINESEIDSIDFLLVLDSRLHHFHFLIFFVVWSFV